MLPSPWDCTWYFFFWTSLTSHDPLLILLLESTLVLRRRSTDVASYIAMSSRPKGLRCNIWESYSLYKKWISEVFQSLTAYQNVTVMLLYGEVPKENLPLPSHSVAVLFGLCSWLKRLWMMSDRLVLGSKQSCPAGHNPSSSTSRVKTNGCSTSVTTRRRCPSTDSPGLQRPPVLLSPWPSPPLTPAPRPCPGLLPNPPTNPRIPPSNTSLPRVHWPTVTQAGWPRAPLFRLHTWNSWEDRTRERPASTWIRPVAPVKEVLERNLVGQTDTGQ